MKLDRKESTSQLIRGVDIYNFKSLAREMGSLDHNVNGGVRIGPLRRMWQDAAIRATVN